ncbi:basement membrane-specific heparan sulfate proteoglycan core protein [Lates calcarifer]|uniref:Basement membrane-specific heparan sulfate proteoglycan core protein n=1 Tax=Lates calcarifer TaxID=8187 RepID=A0AAJ7LD62_LATCA|nr:basement membrane-specific heparan sulfate proteoglycan core protein [Lates calcarifer]
MFFILLVFSLMSFLCDFHVSSCDENCADKPVFTPSRLVVKHGDPTSATCSVKNVYDIFNLEKSLGDLKTNGTEILWKVEKMTEWDMFVMCYYELADHQCCSTLPITVYKPPDNVPISFRNHSGPLLEGHQYTLQCEVHNVAPVENLTVTFYRGQTALGQLQSNNTEKKPVTEIFTLNINTSKEDDGVQYWCVAELELGPEGPQPPIVLSSHQRIRATVLYKPQLLVPPHPDRITITEGSPLQLNCTAVGNPSPSYTWVLPPSSLLPSNSNVLTIKSVASEHGGQYTCEVSNKVGNVTVMFHVDVEGLELTSTKLPPITTTSMTTTTPNSSTSSTLIHRFIMCFMLLFSVVV